LPIIFLIYPIFHGYRTTISRSRLILREGMESTVTTLADKHPVSGQVRNRSQDSNFPYEIRIDTDRLISLAEIPRILPPNAKGRLIGISSIYRWASQRGVNGVVLPTLDTPGGRCSSIEALQWFLVRLTDLRREPASKKNRTQNSLAKLGHAQDSSPRQKEIQRAHESVERILKKNSTIERRVN